VQNGADFATLAKEHSDDRRSAGRGGALGTIQSVESLPPWFQQAVTQLDSVGAVSGIVESQYGYHIVKLTDRIEPPSFEEAYDDLKEKVSQSRIDEQKTKFSREVRREVGATVDTSAILKGANVSTLDTLSRPLLYPESSSQSKSRQSPSVVSQSDSIAPSDSIAQQGPVRRSSLDENPPPEGPIATVGDSSYTYGQLSDHLMEVDGGAQMTIAEVVEDFLNEKAFQYAAARLETRDSSFAASMKQYREGLLVFQFMQDSVWSVARQDTAGLRRTYQERKDQYRYPDRVRTVVLRADADSLLTPYTSGETDTADVSAVVERSTADSLVSVDTMLVTETSPEVYRRVLSLEDGTTTGPVQRNASSLLLVRDTLLPARPKTFAEARSSVVRDYQEIYEEDVLSRLRRRYDVQTYPERLRQAFDDASPTASSTP
jgi:peptidyl-prolyl cis-trans isomerase SurA